MFLNTEQLHYYTFAFFLPLFRSSDYEETEDKRQKAKQERRTVVSKNTIIQLIVAIFALGLFLISWLVFKNIKISDWIILAVGILDLVVFFLQLKKDKK